MINHEDQPLHSQEKKEVVPQTTICEGAGPLELAHNCMLLFWPYQFQYMFLGSGGSYFLESPPPQKRVWSNVCETVFDTAHAHKCLPTLAYVSAGARAA